jgi:hypothetical protein
LPKLPRNLKHAMPADQRFSPGRIAEIVRHWFDKPPVLEGPGANARRLALDLIDRVQAASRRGDR